MIIPQVCMQSHHLPTKCLVDWVERNGIANEWNGIGKWNGKGKETLGEVHRGRFSKSLRSTTVSTFKIGEDSSLLDVWDSIFLEAEYFSNPHF